MRRIFQFDNNGLVAPSPLYNTLFLFHPILHFSHPKPIPILHYYVLRFHMEIDNIWKLILILPILEICKVIICYKESITFNPNQQEQGNPPPPPLISILPNMEAIIFYKTWISDSGLDSISKACLYYYSIIGSVTI